MCAILQLKLTDGSWPKFPRFGSFEVWALLPGKAEPQCVFSKIKEKRFPSKNEVRAALSSSHHPLLISSFSACTHITLLSCRMQARFTSAPALSSACDAALRFAFGVRQVISRIADALQTKLENVAPMCEYVAPPKKDKICKHCEMGKIVDNQCNWCGSIQLERRGRMGTSHRGT